MAMNILVTNDDGIYSEGLEILASWAKKLGDVTIVAPKTQQSAKSHSINIHTPFEVKKFDWIKSVECYSVDSTPADCIRFAFAGLHQNFDLVLSGVNKGYNLGEDIAYSGTDGAIFEAAYFKCNAIAFSTDFDTYEGSEPKIDAAYKYIIDNNLFAYNNLYNVNYPTADSNGILFTKQGDAYFKDNFVEVGPNMYQAQGYSTYQNTQRLDQDLDAVMNGYTSISPLTVNRTAQEAYEKLAKILQK